MALVILPWYRSDSPRHNSELMMALFHNLQCPGVDRVYLVSEYDPPSLAHSKLEFIRVDERPSFSSLFGLAATVPGPFIIVNADCALVDARAVDRLEPNDALWITRWDVRNGAPLSSRYALSWGADAFAFPAVPDRLPENVGAPGEAYCDRVIGRALAEAGYRVRNLPWAVPLLHFHAERVRSEDERRPSSGEYTAYSVRPTDELRSPLWKEPFVERVP